MCYCGIYTYACDEGGQVENIQRTQSREIVSLNVYAVLYSVHDQVCMCRNFIPSVRTVKEHNVLFNPIAYTCQMFVLLYC